MFSVQVSVVFQDSPPRPDMEQKLRSASSVDELMSLIYPSYWAALKCRSKLSAAAASSKLSQRPQPRRLRPPAYSEEPTFAAAYLNLDVLKSMFVFLFISVKVESFLHASLRKKFVGYSFLLPSQNVGSPPAPS